MGIPAKKYFNAGVMLLNLKAWRENNLSRNLILTAKKYMDKLLWWDQDVLNIYLFDKWQQFPSGYNEKGITKRLNVMPVIIHYAGNSKPWHYLNNHPYKELYWKYLRLSSFKNYKYPDFSIKNIVRRLLFGKRYM
jgi:lipopolysaccharide biosynthesis glycosyltransferase